MTDPYYSESHRDRFNLLLHLFAVPLFWLATFAALTFAAMGAWSNLAWASAGFGVSLGLQAMGHKREKVPPRAFTGPLDFITRIFREQFHRFPALVLNGQWWRNFRGG